MLQTGEDKTGNYFRSRKDPFILKSHFRRPQNFLLSRNVLFNLYNTMG